LAYLHFVEGHTGGSRVLPNGVDLQVLRKHFDGPYMANNGYDLAMAKAARIQELADVIAFGRPFIANPDLVERFQTGITLAHAPQDTYYGGGAGGYIDWPAAAG
jgi:N-ethylmaleimide reductase